MYYERYREDMILSTDSQLDGPNENSINGSPNTVKDTESKQTWSCQQNNRQMGKMNNGNENVTALWC